MPHKCSGVKLTGYFKGFQCNSPAHVQVMKQWYCRLHSWFAKNDPEAFVKARRSAERKMGKQQ